MFNAAYNRSGNVLQRNFNGLHVMVTTLRASIATYRCSGTTCNSNLRNVCRLIYRLRCLIVNGAASGLSVLCLRQQLTLFNGLCSFERIFPTFHVLVGVLTAQVANEINSRRALFVRYVDREEGSTINNGRGQSIRKDRFFALFPPNVTVITCGVEVFLRDEVVINERRFAVYVSICPHAFYLSRWFFRVLRIVTTGRGSQAVLRASVRLYGFKVAMDANVNDVR